MALTAWKCLDEVQKMLHFMTLSSEAPAASRHCFICSMTRSACRSIGIGFISPVTGSNGGRPETKIMLPARVTAEAGAFQRSSQLEIGSTRMTSRFMDAPYGFGGGNPSMLAAYMLR